MVNPALPDVIAPYRLADRDAELSGVIEGKRLRRVCEAAEPLGDVRVHAVFGRNDEGYRCADGSVELLLQVPCERCREPLALPVEAEFSLVLVSEEAQLQSVPRYLDPWLVAPGVDVPVEELVEDTVLLALPPFPAHPEGECEIRTLFTGSEDEDGSAVADDDDPAESGANERAKNPFSVLAQMKTRPPNQE